MLVGVCNCLWLQVNQAIYGNHGVNVQFIGINFLESLVYVTSILVLICFSLSYVMFSNLRLRFCLAGIWIFSNYFKCIGPSKGVSWAVSNVIRAKLSEGSWMTVGIVLAMKNYWSYPSNNRALLFISFHNNNPFIPWLFFFLGVLWIIDILLLGTRCCYKCYKSNNWIWCCGIWS